MKVRILVSVITVAVLGALLTVKSLADNDDNRSRASVSDDVATSVSAPNTHIAWQEGLAELTRLQNELFRSPSIAMIDEIVDVTCPCRSDFQEQIRQLLDNDWRYRSDSLRLTNIQLLTETSPNQVLVKAAASSTDSPIVDRAGSVVREAPRVEERPVTIELRRSSDGRWKISNELFPQS